MLKCNRCPTEFQTFEELITHLAKFHPVQYVELASWHGRQVDRNAVAV